MGLDCCERMGRFGVWHVFWFGRGVGGETVQGQGFGKYRLCRAVQSVSNDDLVGVVFALFGLLALLFKEAGGEGGAAGGGW
jgi:hypothetical protein